MHEIIFQEFDLDITILISMVKFTRFLFGFHSIFGKSLGMYCSKKIWFKINRHAQCLIFLISMHIIYSVHCRKNFS